MDDKHDSAATEPEKPGASRPYLDMLSESEKAFEDYQQRCSSIDKRFASLKTLADANGDREFQIFWANLEVLKPTIYSRAPKPVVQPRHRDGKEVLRKASELLERVLEVDVEADDLHDTLVMVRDDLALNARGVPWVLDNGQCIHVDRHDFRHEPSRKWSETGWVARRAYMTKDALKERFEDVDVDKITFEQINNNDGGEGADYKSTRRKVAVWEIWSRAEGKVVWVTQGYSDVLEASEPLVNVKGFFPCPKPAYGTLERGTLLPVPDYVYYRDQVDEINELTARISSLAESLRLKGFYASGTSEVGEAIEAAMKATDNRAILVPVSSAAAMGAGSLKDAIVWLPVKEIAEVITQLIALRRQLIEDVYEITGLSDIMRGSTEASETATAQNLKAQYGSVRVRERQAEMVRVARDILRLKAEIYAETVPAEELAAMAGMDFQPEEGDTDFVPLEAIDAVLKNERLRPFLLEVESDSTIAPNEQEEKASRIEFITAMGDFIQRAGVMVAQQPETAPFAAELMKFTAGAFRAGRDLGGAIDEFAEMMKQKASEAVQGQQGPTPEQIKAQADAQKVSADMQAAQLKSDNETARLQADIEKMRLEAGISAEQAQADLEKTRAEIAKVNAEIARIVAQTEAANAAPATV